MEIKSYDQSEEKYSFRSICHETQVLDVKVVAGDEAWIDPIGDDHAVPGFWRWDRIVFSGTRVTGQRDWHFAAGGQRMAQFQKDVQAIHDVEDPGSGGGSVI